VWNWDSPKRWTSRTSVHFSVAKFLLFQQIIVDKAAKRLPLEGCPTAWSAHPLLQMHLQTVVRRGRVGSSGLLLVVNIYPATVYSTATYPHFLPWFHVCSGHQLAMNFHRWEALHVQKPNQAAYFDLDHFTSRPDCTPKLHTVLSGGCVVTDDNRCSLHGESRCRMTLIHVRHRAPSYF
jgi:hypothetical protein